MEGFFYRDFCTNGCVFGFRKNDLGFRRSHLGKTIESVDYEILSDETIEQTNAAIMSLTADVVNAAGSQEYFDKMVSKLRETTEGPTVVDPIGAVQELGRAVGVSQANQKSVLENLIRDGDYSRWGMVNAVTRLANDHESYDAASEFEGFGAKLIDMQMRDWSRIAETVAERVN